MILFATEDVNPAKYLVFLSKIFKNKIFFKGSKINNFLLKENNFKVKNDFNLNNFFDIYSMGIKELFLSKIE